MLRPTAVVELVWQDASGSTASVLMHSPSSSTLAEIDASAVALASILMPLTGCVLVRQRIKYISKPEAPVTASDSTPIARTGAFYFDCEDETPDALITVPSIKDSLIFTEGLFEGVGIDTSNSDVVAFADAVIGSGTANPFADAITALIAAYRVSRV